jgi:hypothetical protein
MAALDCLPGDHLARFFQVESCRHFRPNHFDVCVDTPGHAGRAAVHPRLFPFGAEHEGPIGAAA